MPLSFVHVTAASRLHFGLIAVRDSGPSQFGGVGVMVEPPQTRLRVIPAERFAAEGPGAERVLQFIDLCRSFRDNQLQPPCQVLVESLPRMHAGLGVGTQLGLAVSAGLHAFWQLPQLSPEELAASVQRGVRSAVGTHGFFHGGLVYETGKSPDQTLAPLGTGADLPEPWCFVLICLHDQPGLHGGAEQRVFDSLASEPSSTMEILRREVTEQMLPAARTGDVEEFGESLYRFGHLAGMYFAGVQGGPYNGPQLTAIVELLRQWGIRGVGQSSWGPTIFALCPDQSAADSLVSRLQSQPFARQAEIWIARPRNHGASVTVTDTDA
jgi:beta-RFAP synthase